MKDTKLTRKSSEGFSRRDFISTSLKVGAAAFTTSLITTRSTKAEQKYNVLFFMVDDLRPLLGCYGYPELHTPNIDRLANRGTVFNQAYCQWPLCSPSRTSYLTGLRPETTGVTNNRYFFRDTAPNTVTLPQHFKANGYHTQSVGRVFHLPDFQDDEYSWSVPSWRPAWTRIDYETTPSWQALDVDDDTLRDGKTAVRAVQVLKQLKTKPFFMAVGFYKPHLPFRAPKKYFELYDNTSFDLPFLPVDDTWDINPPHWNEARPYQDIPDGNEPITDEKVLELIRAYAANTSFTDAQIGRVLDQLESLGLMESTVIAFCGDHGYNLSENGNIGKNIVYEATLHSPLIVSIPGQTYPGEATDAIVELVDIFPTLCDACEIPLLKELEGLSMCPVMEQPSLPWKTAAFSQRNQQLSMRTDRYRYTEVSNLIELYDYGVNPYSEENIAHLPENAELVTQLSAQLHAGWQAALPEIIPQKPPKTLKWDVNDDGMIDINDLLMISDAFNSQSPKNPKVDVNMDGNVNIIDLLLVAAHLEKSSIAAAPKHLSIKPKIQNYIEEWLSEARLIGNDAPILKKGIENLELLINKIIPKESLLLPNYPNPFNPETWIPYQLAAAADVSISIYTADGKLIRTLNIGHQPAGKYHHRRKAAHWDGKNAEGEAVASGLYFYTLSAGKFTATRKMFIRK